MLKREYTIDEQIAHLEKMRGLQIEILFHSTNDYRVFLEGEKVINDRIDQAIREI